MMFTKDKQPSLDLEPFFVFLYYIMIKNKQSSEHRIT